MTVERNVKGLLGTKLGMTQLWDANNRVVPVTVVQAGPCVVTQVRTADRDGYSAVQLGFGQIDPRKVTKPLAGHFEAAGVTPRRHVVELRTADADSYAAAMISEMEQAPDAAANVAFLQAMPPKTLWPGLDRYWSKRKG